MILGCVSCVQLIQIDPWCQDNTFNTYNATFESFFMLEEIMAIGHDIRYCHHSVYTLVVRLTCHDRMSHQISYDWKNINI